jgi:hypothetical protein
MPWSQLEPNEASDTLIDYCPVFRYASKGRVRGSRWEGLS